ncbi:MAG: RIP metalloprotease RseP [Rickettsiales bacterium]|nr:RIP metalloprotease RseP [Rickettsiales bacterium]
MLDIFYNIFIFVIVISVIVFVHEYGHYYVARLCGVMATDFSIGFGKKICGFKDKRGTEWKISMIPLGGYVKFLGDTDFTSAQDSKPSDIPEHIRKHAFATQNLLKKFAIVAAGPIANFIFAIIIFAAFYLYFGKVVVAPEVTFVEKGSVAEKSGFKQGDVVVNIDGNKIDQFSDVEMYVTTHPNIQLSIAVSRNGEIEVITVVPQPVKVKDSSGEEIEIGKLGIGSNKFTKKDYNILSATAAAYSESLKITTISLKALGQMITGKRDTKDLGSVIRISKYAGKSAKQGVFVLVWFMAMISLNLGLVNLFPIPPLDGGHLFLYITRFCLGKKISSYVEKWLLRVGIMIIVFLMVFTIVNDILHI